MESKRKPPKLDDPKVEALLQALNAGHYVERASRMSNISLTTIYRWLDEGKKERESVENGDEPTTRGQSYLQLAEAIQKAREAAAHRAMLTIQKAAQDGTWQAAAWFLERTDKEHYGRYTQVAGTDGGAVKLKVSVEDMEKVLKEIIDQETGVGSADAS